MFKRFKRKRGGVRNAFEDGVKEVLLKNKVTFAYEGEKIPYVIYGNYINDFPCVALDGHKVFIETKGLFRREDKRKLAAVKKQYPEIDLRIIFYKEVKTNTRWAIKHKIPFSIRTIPPEWLDELRT